MSGDELYEAPVIIGRKLIVYANHAMFFGKLYLFGELKRI